MWAGTVAARGRLRDPKAWAPVPDAPEPLEHWDYGLWGSYGEEEDHEGLLHWRDWCRQPRRGRFYRHTALHSVAEQTEQKNSKQKKQ